MSVTLLAWNQQLCSSLLERRCNASSALPCQAAFSSSPFFAPAATFPVLRASRRESPSSSLDVSVFRFTLGIPGFNDSDLPRALGFAFGAVLLLNHLFAADYVRPAQWRSEIIGLLNAILAISLPAIGQILNGRTLKDAASSMSNSRQIFLLSKNLSLESKEEMAWGSYTLLKNTRTTSLVIWNEELLCARGFWDIPSEAEGDAMKWLEKTLKESAIFTYDNLAYVPFKADEVGWEFLPAGVICSLVVPSAWSPAWSPEEATGPKRAFILLLSSTPNAFSEKDMQWIEWLSKRLLQSKSHFEINA